MNNFVDLLKRAFGLWWRVKILWPLGMLAALVGYGDAGVGGNFNTGQSFSVDNEAELPPWIEDLAANPLLLDFVNNPVPYIVGVIAAALILALVMALLGALAHGALIRTADVADQGYAASLGDGLRVGAARILPLFLINLIMALPVFLIGLALIVAITFSLIGAIRTFDGGGAVDPGAVVASVLGLVFCTLGMFALLWVVSILLGVWSRIAQRACVIEGCGPLTSLGRAWGLIRRNLGLTLLSWLLQGVLGTLVGFVLAIPAVALVIPVIVAVAQGNSLPIGLLIALVIYAILASVLVGGMLTAFNSTMWTVMFRHFVAREQPYESYGAA